MNPPDGNSVMEISSSLDGDWGWCDPLAKDSDISAATSTELRPDDLSTICPLSSSKERNCSLSDSSHSLLPQLHPTVSMGTTRLSSHECRNSEDSDNVAAFEESLSVVSAEQQGSDTNPKEPSEGLKYSPFRSGSCLYDSDTSLQGDDRTEPSPSLLYHDVLMNVFTFLDAKSFAAFSETARRPNFECFYYLQIQLQKALVRDAEDENSSLISDSTPFTRVVAMSRLATLNRSLAEETVEQFRNSNSSLGPGTMMTLSCSLVYIRQLLRLHGLDEHSMTNAAFFVAAAVADSWAGAYAAIIVGALFSSIRDLLLRSGFVGSLVRAARIILNCDPTLSLRAFVRATLQALYCTTHGYDSSSDSGRKGESQSRLVDLDAVNDNVSLVGSGDLQPSPQSPNPYEHLLGNGKEGDSRMPSGCVGAFMRAAYLAQTHVRSILKERRRRRFLSLPGAERQLLATIFIDACRSDDCLGIVQDLVQVQETIDVDGVYVDSNGIETCALHTSVLHGSLKILEFLCRGIDESNPSNDGAHCDVDIQDAHTGWTALHFAVAVYSIDAVRTLANHGADITIIANNRCTPLMWARRLMSEEVVEELSKREPRSLEENRERKGWTPKKGLRMAASRSLRTPSVSYVCVKSAP